MADFAPGDRVLCRQPGRWYDGRTGTVAALDVHEDEGTPLHRLAVGGVFVAVPVECLTAAPGDPVIPPVPPGGGRWNGTDWTPDWTPRTAIVTGKGEPITPGTVVAEDDEVELVYVGGAPPPTFPEVQSALRDIEAAHAAVDPAESEPDFGPSPFRALYEKWFAERQAELRAGIAADLGPRLAYLEGEIVALIAKALGLPEHLVGEARP
jgi:hypothetical protein